AALRRPRRPGGRRRPQRPGAARAGRHAGPRADRPGTTRDVGLGGGRPAPPEPAGRAAGPGDGLGRSAGSWGAGAERDLSGDREAVPDRPGAPGRGGPGRLSTPLERVSGRSPRSQGLLLEPYAIPSDGAWTAASRPPAGAGDSAARPRPSARTTPA